MKGETKQISEAYLICSEDNKKHVSPFANKVNVLHIIYAYIYTVSVGTAIQFLNNEYLIGGKLKGIDPIITPNLSQKLQTKKKIAEKAFSGMQGMIPKILGGYEYSNPHPHMGSQRRGMIWIDTVFTISGKNYYFFVLKKYPQVCERCVPNRTHPNGRPKEDGGELYAVG